MPVTGSARDAATVPEILFVCVHNAGRSIAAAVLTEHYAKGRVRVRSAGSEPGSEVNPAVAQVLRCSCASRRPGPFSRKMPSRASVHLLRFAAACATRFRPEDGAATEPDE